KLTEAVVEVMKIRAGDAHDTSVAAAIEALLAHLAAVPPGLLGTAADHVVLRAEDAVGVFAAGGLRWVTEPRHARALLRALGFLSGSHRDPHTKKVLRGYKITHAELSDLAARHLPPAAAEPEAQGASP